MRTIGLLVATLMAGVGPAGAQADSAARADNQPVAPVRLIGNIYYVGAADIAAFLVRTHEGLILLDGGYADMAEPILAEIKSLGFDPRSVKVLLNSHAHYDHAGGLAALKRATGAELYAGAGDSALLARGGHGDFGFGDRFLFPPVTVDHAVRDGDRVTLGEVTLTAVATPGHTHGCTTWTMEVEEGTRRYSVVFFCSLSIPGYSLVAPETYPGIARDYQTSIARLRNVRCDIPLAPHGGIFALSDKLARLRNGRAPLAFVDPAGCREVIERAAAAVAQGLRGSGNPSPGL